MTVRFPLFPQIGALLRRLSSALPLLGGLLALGLAAAPAQAFTPRHASMVVDADTGRVLQASNADQRDHPASLTKIMTLYLLFDALESGKVHLYDRIPISRHAAAQAPSHLGLPPGDSLPVQDAILAICTKSANDIAVAVAEYLGGSEPAFSAMMTRKARELGMRQSNFVNASGLPNRNQWSSAHDMVILARAMLRDHARYYHYFSTREFTYNGQTMRNHNHLMDHYEGMDGMKTGYIATSGFNLVASVRRNGHRLIGVVFGGSTARERDHHMAQLLDAAFVRDTGNTGVAMDAMPAQPGANDEAAAEPPAAPAPQLARHHRHTRAEARAEARARHLREARARAKARREREEQQAQAEDDSSDTEDGWGIQVGAFSQHVRAQKAARQAVHQLGHLVADGDISIAHSRSRHGSIYRARVISLPKATARAACRRLAHKHMSCSVIEVASR
ncbi:D-alanyl-D-alanine carboxypeptidase DacF precursor [mine drainage metagenome]|uniref:D-alanyl-D-alanine carboxypeptidase DacF n=1 Tax=mine drainage metagenome TaxID=410659 RepID=A0A1J5RH74_9ZZZZ